MEQVETLPGERTGVFVGMEPDVEVCRYGLRWRQAQRLRDAGLPPEQHAAWLATTEDKIIPTLTSTGVLGTMPNIPANRLNSQFDLGGASYSVSAGEDSGLAGLALAVRSLVRGELDAALVGAVDVSCQEVHTQAVRSVTGENRAPGDAAVVLVLKRLADAERDGDRVVALLKARPSDEKASAGIDLDPVLGQSWAAGDLRDLCAAALCASHRADPDGRPWIGSDSETREVHVGGRYRFSLEAHDAPNPALSVPRLHLFAAADKQALLAELEAGRENGEGPCLLVILAASAEQLAERKNLARAHIEGRTPALPGIHFREQPVEGEIALVFTGAGSAYPDMGRELLQALPGLGEDLQQLSSEAALALATPWTTDVDTPALQKLWSASALCQLHGLLTQKVLGLKPDAVIGYSSGESNSLFATGTWTDMDAMIQDATAGRLFTQEIGGDLNVLKTAWEGPATWETWTVLAPVSEVQALVDQHARVYLSVIHTDEDCIVAGEAAGCAAVIEAVGRQRCLRLHYDLTVHVPLLDAVREPWLALHRRTITPQANLRIYSGGHGGSYLPSEEACAEAILGQANQTLDFRAVIESAWQDGVRIFVEHGPQGSCSRWIREILGDREAVVVCLDRKGKVMVAAIGTPTEPADLRVVSASGGMRTITNANPQVASWKLPQISVVGWTGTDGVPVEGILETSFCGLPRRCSPRWSTCCLRSASPIRRF